MNDYHAENNAKFGTFAGYSMPINYSDGIIKEHLHVRSSVGVFDVSHMGQILILVSKSNISNLQRYIPLNLYSLKANKSYYSFILNHHHWPRFLQYFKESHKYLLEDQHYSKNGHQIINIIYFCCNLCLGFLSDE